MSAVIDFPLQQLCIPVAYLCVRPVLLTGVFSTQEGQSTGWFITMTSKWARWRLKSSASRLFPQPLIQGADQIKHQNSASLAFVRGIHRWPVNSPHKGSVTQEMFPFYDVIMSWSCWFQWCTGEWRTCYPRRTRLATSWPSCTRIGPPSHSWTTSSSSFQAAVDVRSSSGIGSTCCWGAWPRVRTTVVWCCRSRHRTMSASIPLQTIYGWRRWRNGRNAQRLHKVLEGLMVPHWSPDT